MYETDLDDIESQLYSQVFHSTDVSEDKLLIKPIITTAPKPEMNKRNRYWETQQNTTVSSPKFPNVESGKHSTSRNNLNQGGYYSKTIGKSARYDPIYQTKSQKSFDTPPIGKRKQRKLRALAARARKQNRVQTTLPAAQLLPPPPPPPVVAPPSEVPSLHITLSDSEDDDSCIVVENNWPIVSVTESDEEVKSQIEHQRDSAISNSDDVIFVEPVEIPCEVINLDEIDEDSEVNVSSEKEHVFSSPQKVKQIHQERSELLATPDSTSNDFMNNCEVDLDRSNFNFELHGTEFKNDNFTKNSTTFESCETESESSTTTDLNTPVIIKSAVFNEVDFPRNDLFDESNMETFGKFITPLRKSLFKNVDTIQSSPVCKSPVVSNTYCSDSSSSESDFDDEDTAKQNTNWKGLPNLSPMQPPNLNTDNLEESTIEDCKNKRKSSNCKDKKNKKKRKAAIESNVQQEPNTSKSVSQNTSNEKVTPLEREEVSTKNILSYSRRSLVDQDENKKSSSESDSSKKKTKKKAFNNQETTEDRMIVETISKIDSNTDEADVDSFKNLPTETQETLKKKGKRRCLNKPEIEEAACKDEHLGDEINKKQSNETSESFKRKARKKNLSTQEAESNHTEESLKAIDNIENQNDNNKTTDIEIQEVSKRKSRKKSISNPEMEDEVTNQSVAMEHDEQNVDKNLSSDAQDSSRKRTRKKSLNSQETDAPANGEASSNIKHSEPENDKNQVEKVCNETHECTKRKSKKKSVGSQEAENTTAVKLTVEASETKEPILDDNSNRRIEETNNINEATTTIDQNNKVNNDQAKISDKTANADNSQLKDLVILDETFADNSKIVAESDVESVLSELNADVNIDLANVQTQAESERNDLSMNILTRPSLSLAVASLEVVQRFMSNDRSLWKILDSDKYPGKRPSTRRCNRCRDRRHIGIRCPKNLTPVCVICGGKDHYEPRCPNKICMQCGKRRDYFTTYCSECFNLRFYQCTICAMMGHSEDRCPDLWRRYHLTTEEGPLNISEAPPLKPVQQQWCSACAQPGHLEFTCNYVRSYPPQDPRIQCYEDVLGSDAENTSLNKSYESLPPPPNFNHFYQGNHFSQLPIMDLGGYTDFSLPYNNMLNNVPNIGAIADLSRLLLPYAANIAQNSYPNENSYREQNRNIPPRCRPPKIRGRQINNKRLDHEQPQHSAKSRENVIDYNSRHDLSTQIMKATQIWNRKSNSLFFSGSTEKIAGVISSSLADLSKLSVKSRQDPVQFKKSLTFNKQNVNDKLGGYYKTLNMVLFGIYNLVDGKMHLSRLKTMKFNKINTKLSHNKRQELMTSYAYIFGNKKNDGIDYNELLRRI